MSTRTAGRSPLTSQTRGLSSTWSFVALVLLVAALGGTGVAALRERADDARREQLVVERLQSLANEQSSLEWQAVAARGAAEQLARAVRARRTAIEDALAELEGIGQPDPLLRRAFEDYQTALDEELGLLAAGDEDSALEIGERRVDPGLERLLAVLERSRGGSAAKAGAAGFNANAGAGLILGIAAICFVLLLRSFQRTRRSLVGAEERALRESERWFRSLVQNASELIVVIDLDTRVRYVTDSVESLLGHAPSALLGRKLIDLAHPDDVGHLKAVALSEGGSGHAFEFRLLRRDGAWAVMEWARGARSDAAGCVLTGRDVSERKRLEHELRHQAFHDSLTELANRALFEDRLAHALAGLKRREVGLSVLFIDLDDFKTVNDSLGHSVGDALLRAVGERLRQTLRGSDTAARLGGDEFGVLLDGTGTASGASDAAQRLLRALEPPFQVEGRQLSITASIGIALASTGAETLADLMRNADLAMYEAKRRGGAQSRVYEESLHAAALGRLELGAELQTAVDEGQFELRFQPIVRLDTAAIVGVEALVRWRHPERGLLAPGHFLPLAEQTGLIVPIGSWVLAEACQTVQSWQEHSDAALPYLSVNVSARQLDEAAVVEDVRGALAEAQFPASRLVLEITESLLADESEATLARLQRLRSLGVRLAVDDFGTGYSALSYLQRFPIDMLKIDRSFVEHARRASASLNLVRSIVQLSRSLHLDTVAEGIEDAEQAHELLAMGVQVGQGFYFAEPLEPERLAELLTAQAPRAPTTVASAGAARA